MAASGRTWRALTSLIAQVGLLFFQAMPLFAFATPVSASDEDEGQRGSLSSVPLDANAESHIQPWMHPLSEKSGQCRLNTFDWLPSETRGSLSRLFCSKIEPFAERFLREPAFDKSRPIRAP